MRSGELGEVVPQDISMMMSQFQPLSPRQSPVAVSSGVTNRIRGAGWVLGRIPGC